MIKYNGQIVQFGFGAVGKSFYEKVSKEIQFDKQRYFIITRDDSEFESYMDLGGVAQNFIIADINRDNWKNIFSKYLSEGDLFIDFADSVGTGDFCEWCAENNIMYINTGETDWSDHWYNIFDESDKKIAIINKYKNQSSKNKYPIVLNHGNNPGLVSHFVKAGIEYIINSQFNHDKQLKILLKENKFNEIAKQLGIKMIHVNDIDLQKVDRSTNENYLISPWCINSFWYEMLSEATFDVGTHEHIDYVGESALYDEGKGYFKFQDLAIDKQCRTYYPHGQFNGYMVPHEETVTIARSLEIIENDSVVYRPSVLFLYRPCDHALNFINSAKGKDAKTVIRGYACPEGWEIFYPDNENSGVEYVGVLILGDKFDPVWVGNRVENSFLWKDKKRSYWQTPTITPVSMSALAAVCWMLKNKDKGGIYFPDDILNYKQILTVAEKYISKTIYHTFSKKEIENSLKIDLSNPQTKHFIIK